MPDRRNFDLLVIGAGPGGYVAAIRAAELGMKTACIEKEAEPGGVCLRVGCIPSKALLDSTEYLDFARRNFGEHGISAKEISMHIPKMMERKQNIISGLAGNVRKLLEAKGVQLIRGTAGLMPGNQVEVRDADGGREIYGASSVLLATGSEPVELPFLPYDGERVISSTEALSLESVPGRLGIVGGGYIGLELGSVWTRLGSRVSIIEMLPGIAAALDGQVERMLDRLLRKQGLEIRVNTRVVRSRISGEEVVLSIESGGGEEHVSFDKVLVAVGRKPLTRGLGLEIGVRLDSRGFIIVDEKYRTNIPGLYAIGDLIPGPMLAHKASAEGIAAVEGIAGHNSEVDYDAIPAVIYTSPEVATVGKTEEELKNLGVDYRAGVYPFTGNDRARCLGETAGLVKMLSHARSGRILGVHIIGPRASELLAECMLAMRLHIRAEDLQKTIHAHPSLSEAVAESAAQLTR